MPTQRLIGLTMFRAKDDVVDLDELIPGRDDVGRFLIESFGLDDGSIALVHCSTSAVRAPRWARFLAGIVDPDALRSASSSAVIAFQRVGVWYLVTFGYARYQINLDLIEPSFGLRATLNGIDPNKIRSIDKKRVDAVARLTREQLSRDARIGSFGVDVHQDLLSAVTGRPTDEDLGTRMYGKDAVGVRVALKPQGLGGLADRLEGLYQSTDYRERYPWVDNISEVTTPGERKNLDRAFAAALRDGAVAEVDLAPPEILDWSHVEGFMLPGADHLSTSLTLDGYLAVGPEQSELTVDRMRSDKVFLYDADDRIAGHWSVHRCLAGEFVHNGQTYVINDGRWYRVASDFLEEIESAIGQLKTSSVSLPPYSVDDKRESDYNQRVADGSGGALQCLDEKFVYPRSWQDRIEFCDLYRADHTVIHVKRYKNGSKEMSHLFAQAEVALRCLLSDPPLRAEVDELLPGSHKIGAGPVDLRDWRVVFAVVAPQGKALRLPFFSRVALRNSAQLISQLGAAVHFQAIENPG